MLAGGGVRPVDRDSIAVLTAVFIVRDNTPCNAAIEPEEPAALKVVLVEGVVVVVERELEAVTAGVVGNVPAFERAITC